MSQKYPPDWDTRRKKVYRRDNYTCQNCGAKGGPKSDAELHAHHGVPISKGGSHKISNLTTYCKKCHNSIHHDKMAPTSNQSSTESSQNNDHTVLLSLLASICIGSLISAPFRHILYTLNSPEIITGVVPFITAITLGIVIFIDIGEGRPKGDLRKSRKSIKVLLLASILWLPIIGVISITDVPPFNQLIITLLIYPLAYGIYKFKMSDVS